MPANILIGSAPPDLVERVTVSAGYVQPGSGDVLSIGQKVFSSAGGTFNGSIPSNESGKFPKELKVNILVDYTVACGLKGISPSFTVPVTEAGASLNWEVPNKIPVITHIRLDFLMGRLDTLNVHWEQLVATDVIKSGFQTIIPVGGIPFDWTPNPNRIDVTLYSQSDATNTFRLWIDPGRLDSKDLNPFELKQDLRSSSIQLKCQFPDEKHAQLVAIVT